MSASIHSANSEQSHPENRTEQPLAESHIGELVRIFYERARADSDLRPVFDAAVHDWDDHLKTVEDFWSRTLLGTNRYKGRPYAAHAQLPLKPEHFDRWLQLFRETAREVLPAETALQAIARAEHMAESFKAGMFAFPHNHKPTLGHPAR